MGRNRRSPEGTHTIKHVLIDKHTLCTRLMRPFVPLSEGHECIIEFTCIHRARAEDTVVVQVFEDPCTPSGNTAYGKNRRKHLG